MKEVQIHMSTVATLAQKIPAEATVSISHEPGSAAAITIAIMIAVMVMLTVAITVMALDHHNWMTMPTGISVVISITVSISEVNRYATALFRDHHWPIRRCRSSKRGNGQK
jgi:phosphopantetheinyl transferase (holo-ACP synthase)